MQIEPQTVHSDHKLVSGSVIMRISLRCLEVKLMKSYKPHLPISSFINKNGLGDSEIAQMAIVARERGLWGGGAVVTT